VTKILILGAHGQIARVATRLLLERTDAELTLYLRKAKRLSALTGNDRVRLVEGDVLYKAALGAAMAGQEVVYANLSGDMEKQARAIVATMNRAGLCRLISSSSARWASMTRFPASATAPYSIPIVDRRRRSRLRISTTPSSAPRD
jgi:uncharacterized protein YbjT (DUF2867 family)